MILLLNSCIQTKYEVYRIIYIEIQNNNNNKNNKKMNKLKFKSNQILKLNNQIFLPYLIHNLPKKYSEFPINSIIKINSIIYINSNNFTPKYTQNYINTLNYSNINSNNIK